MSDTYLAPSKATRATIELHLQWAPRGRVEWGGVTFEEAPAQFGVWLKQRSRWQKGYMQTWLVHTRRPLGLIARAGIGGFLAFHLFVGGSVAAALATPLLWFVLIVSLWAPHPAGAALPLSSLAAGNLLLTLPAMASPMRRGWRGLSPYGLSVALYWGMVALAAWRGLWQLATNPFYWEKTMHGLSRHGQ